MTSTSRRILIAASWLLFAAQARTSYAIEEVPAFAKKFQDGLLTAAYGIVTEKDLKIEAERANTTPFNASEGIDGYKRWQCFAIRDVKLKVRKWRDEDPRGFAGVIVPMCDLDIWVTEAGRQIQVFSGRRALNGEWCQEFSKNWRRLTAQQKHVCLSGEHNGVSEPRPPYPSTPFRSWTWDKIKSKKGCYAYFGGEDCK